MKSKEITIPKCTQFYCPEHDWDDWKTEESVSYAFDKWKVVQTRVCRYCGFRDLNVKIK